MMRALLVILAALSCASSSAAVTITFGGNTPSSFKPSIYRPCETQVIVYDPRPELGIGMHAMSQPAMRMVQALGIRLVRHTLYWNLMETTDKPGLYDSKYLAEWDKLVEDCRKEGIALEVVVHGDPPGVSYASRAAAYQRYARFVADMAARYPSVIYWELFNEMDSGFTCLFGASDNVQLMERGKNYAEMLKIAYPAIKAANPAAQVLCGGMVDTTEFPRGIYEGGGMRYFDIMNIHTYGVPVVTAFVERGKNIRKVMAEFGDEGKPVWNTEFGIDAGNVVGAWGYPHSWSPAQEDGPAFDQKQLEDYQNCLAKNNDLHLFDKLIPYQFLAGNERDDDHAIKTNAKLPQGLTIDDYGFGIVRSDMSPRPTYKWLEETKANAAITKTPSSTVSVFVPTRTPTAPVGYQFKNVEGGIEIQRVVVDSIIPTAIQLIYVSEPPPVQPGTKPAPKKGSSPQPDPWDI